MADQACGDFACFACEGCSALLISSTLLAFGLVLVLDAVLFLVAIFSDVVGFSGLCEVEMLAPLYELVDFAVLLPELSYDEAVALFLLPILVVAGSCFACAVSAFYILAR